MQDTVITFFPARWGRNENDNSDVHRRLRLRLKAIHQPEIHSAYDLAILIIDQCSQVFFDRTAIRSLRPQVLEIFAHAIGDVVSEIDRYASRASELIFRSLSSRSHHSITSLNTLACFL